MKKCPQCHQDNPLQAKFCGNCGSNLQGLCPACGTKNQPEAKFCLECGAKLGDQAAQLPAELSRLPEAERRQITILFCDLVGSTPLSERLDPEELRRLIRDYQSICAKVIRRYDGHIGNYFGDGILVNFGYPKAHEDDPRRAVRTGLGIIEAMRGLNARLRQEGVLKDFSLQVRIAIHTGVVVAGDVDRGEQLESMAIIGEAPNVAARLQGLAEPDTLVVSAETYERVEGFFHCRSLGEHSLKGLSRPVAVYHVLAESTAKSRFDVAEIRGLTPLAGREQETVQLLEYWELAQGGTGQVVLLGGEAGIGKSRMVNVLKSHLSQMPQAWLTECRCSPYYQNTAFYPIIDLFERVVLQFGREDSPEEKRDKLEGFLVQYSLPLEEMMPLFASLLSIPPGRDFAPLNLTPQRQKQKTMEALVTILMRRSQQQPLLFVMEDLHWIDSSTLDLLTLLIDQIAKARMLVVLTFRPDFHPPWSHPNLTTVNLTRLSPQQVEWVVERLSGGKVLPPEVLRQIIARTDGVPLFVEELTKMVLESGLLEQQSDRYELREPLPPLAIPATLSDSLAARLDRLATVKQVAQLGATIGREFSYELLRAVSDLDEATLQRDLSRLVEAEIVYPRGAPPHQVYQFKHALIRDAAYESLLKSRRTQYHLQIAAALETQFPETREAQPELLAHHFTEAGLSREAIPYWQLAGKRAVERSANVEAAGHFRNGIALIDKLPDQPETLEQELELQTALGPALMTTRGFASPEVGQAYNRARELCAQIGETPRLFSTLWGLWYYYAVLPQEQAARELGEQLLDLAAKAKDKSLEMIGHRALGAILICEGKFTAGLAHTTQGIAIYDPEQHRSLAFVYGQDIGIICRQWQAIALWMLGYPDQALSMNPVTVEMARASNHVSTLAYVLYFTAKIFQFIREGKIVRELSEECQVLSASHDNHFFQAAGSVLHGWALVDDGKMAAGKALLHQNINAYQATGAELVVPYWLTLLAEAYAKEGLIDDGLAAVDQALHIAEKGGEHMWDAEIYRIRGELLLLKSEDSSEAEQCFEKALDIARRQEAKSWELRAATSLSRLWRRQDRKAEAGELLAGIYGWFSEGFTTHDLVEARALLDELSAEIRS